MKSHVINHQTKFLSSYKATNSTTKCELYSQVSPIFLPFPFVCPADLFMELLGC